MTEKPNGRERPKLAKSAWAVCSFVIFLVIAAIVILHAFGPTI
jgi:hypothetical protein